MRGLIFLLAFGLLSACSKLQGDVYFPLQMGQSWRYKIVTHFEDSEALTRTEWLTISTSGTDDEAGQEAWHRRSDSGIEYWLKADKTGVYRVASQSPMDVQAQIDREPRYVLKQPYAVGTQWQSDTTPYIFYRRNEFPPELRNLDKYKSLDMSYRIEAVEQTVQTPADTFEHCLLVQGTANIKMYIDALVAWRDVPMITREWYCPHVGLVKLEREESSPSKFVVGGKLSMELVRHRQFDFLASF